MQLQEAEEISASSLREDILKNRSLAKFYGSHHKYAFFSISMQPKQRREGQSPFP